MADCGKEIEPRPLTEQESTWIREILQTNEEWKDTAISKTRVVAEGPCDEGISILLRGPESERTDLRSPSGYVGRIVICTDDDSLIEIRLTYSYGRLDELFILFVDPRNPKRRLPERWTEVSHEATAL